MNDYERLLSDPAARQAHFDRISHCSRCARLLCREIIWPRLYELLDGTAAIVVLCSPCSDAIPLGSESDARFREELERKALVAVPSPNQAQPLWSEK